jgi:hypothetical protein
VWKGEFSSFGQELDTTPRPIITSLPAREGIQSRGWITSALTTMIVDGTVDVPRPTEDKSQTCGTTPAAWTAGCRPTGTPQGVPYTDLSNPQNA